MITEKYLRPIKLRKYREDRKLSRAALARAANLSNADLGRFESGRVIPYDGQIIRIAAALGVDDPEKLMEPLEA